MENKSLIANWIAKCDREIDVKCEGNDCERCKYSDICYKVTKLNSKFKTKILKRSVFL